MSFRTHDGTEHTCPEATASEGDADSISGEKRAVALFICSNCGRSGIAPAQLNGTRPRVPELDLPFSVSQVILPCAGRLQPEHVLKAIAACSDAVCVVSCDETNCHHLEGSLRCRRRLEYVGRILDDVGVGSNRLVLAHLHGSAKEDLACSESHDRARGAQTASTELEGLRRELIARVTALPQNPLRLALANGTSSQTRPCT